MEQSLQAQVGDLRRQVIELSALVERQGLRPPASSGQNTSISSTQEGQGREEEDELPYLNEPNHDRYPATAMWIVRLRVKYEADPHAQVPQLPPFKHPDTELPANWLRNCIELLMDRKIEQSRWPTLIAQAFEGPHKTWWYSVSADNPVGQMPWEHFHTKFFTEFLLRSPHHQQWAELEYLPYQQLDVTTLVERFRRLSLNIPALLPLDKLKDFFRRSLPADLNREIDYDEREDPSEEMEELFRHVLFFVESHRQLDMLAERRRLRDAANMEMIGSSSPDTHQVVDEIDSMIGTRNE
ncbi:hypothetical protein PSEUBRA_003013 [Kalmanozyma brasiliensis GHG001]|uniref:uncharacterized protein n=1 Tax=Kalmanozyma brasiliensis (strain GHG001) TaxID=1365824 RepID=UPI002867BB02|nr:uncharacterized protein PSEUBRA_003013 [Kalmanozyma brasiliensis GHG001]KAF6767167.1 hypothetical protein PSEUBRA_003013 [Kalmanozyma brasiliensis GHG001]